MSLWENQQEGLINNPNNAMHRCWHPETQNNVKKGERVIWWVKRLRRTIPYFNEKKMVLTYIYCKCRNYCILRKYNRVIKVVRRFYPVLNYISLHKLLYWWLYYLFNVYSHITKCFLVKFNIDDLIYGFNLSSFWKLCVCVHHSYLLLFGNFSYLYSVSPLHTNFPVENFQRCEREFTCPIM